MVAICNFGLCLLVLLKLCWFTFPCVIKEGSLKGLCVSDIQCLLVLFETLMRGTTAACKYAGAVGADALALSAILFMLPMLATFWAERRQF